MKLFKTDDALFDIASKIITMLATVGTLAFGVYAYFNTIHPVFEKEKELQGLRSEKLTLESENGRLSNENISLQDKSAESIKRLNMLNENLSKTNDALVEKQNLLDKTNRELVLAQKQTVLGKLTTLREKLLNTALYEMATRRNTEFDVIVYSKTLFPNNSSKISASDRKAFQYFQTYIDSHNKENIVKLDDVIKFAVMLPASYTIHENMLNESD